MLCWVVLLAMCYVLCVVVYCALCVVFAASSTDGTDLHNTIRGVIVRHARHSIMCVVLCPRCKVVLPYIVWHVALYVLHALRDRRVVLYVVLYVALYMCGAAYHMCYT